MALKFWPILKPLKKNKLDFPGEDFNPRLDNPLRKQYTMRKNKGANIILTFLMFVLMIQNVIAAPPIDLNKSTVEWVATKVTGQHSGRVNLKEGSITMEAGMLTGGRFVLDMTSIQVLDIKEEKWNTKLLNHLKNDDFFSVEKYPTAVFEFSSPSLIKTTEKNGPLYHFKGDLTIKGISHVLEFDALVDLKASGSRAQGTIVVDRTKYDIRYRSEKFFENLGDKTIHDEFTITFDVVTK